MDPAIAGTAGDRPWLVRDRRGVGQGRRRSAADDRRSLVDQLVNRKRLDHEQQGVRALLDVTISMSSSTAKAT